MNATNFHLDRVRKLSEGAFPSETSPTKAQKLTSSSQNSSDWLHQQALVSALVQIPRHLLTFRSIAVEIKLLQKTF
jgi:hypothetical protein